VAGSGRQNADSALIVALASGATVHDASAAVGVAERTIYRRLEDAAFRRQVSDARSEMLMQAVGKLADASTNAVSTLGRLLDAESESVQLGAARSILELGTKLREATELDQRLRDLEARAEVAAQEQVRTTHRAWC
jgi:hypothetical protein